jgi:hypothetical protein
MLKKYTTLLLRFPKRLRLEAGSIDNFYVPGLFY